MRFSARPSMREPVAPRRAAPPLGRVNLFCWHSVLGEDGDASSAFAACLLREGVRFGASAPVHPQFGEPIGSLCVFGENADTATFESLVSNGQIDLQLLAQFLFLHLRTISSFGSPASLSNSEHIVFEHLATGMRPREIAEKLGKSEKTIQNQIDSARGRLGAKTTTEAVILWKNHWMRLKKVVSTIKPKD